MDIEYQVRENIANNLITTKKTKQGLLDFLSKKIPRHYTVYRVHSITREVRSITKADTFITEANSVGGDTLDLNFGEGKWITQIPELQMLK